MGDLSAEPSMEEILSSIKRIIAEEGEAPGRHRRVPRGAAMTTPSSVSSSSAPPPQAQHILGSALSEAADEVLELSDPMPATPAAHDLTQRMQAVASSSIAQHAAPSATEPASPQTAQPVWAAFEEDMPARPVEARPEGARSEPARSNAGHPDPAPTEAPIVSPRTADASRGSLDQLSRLLVKPEPGGDGTLEGLVREMLRPMLRDWLDRNLPPLVETMVAREIARITQARE